MLRIALLALKDVHAYYGQIQALRGVSLDVDEGEIVTLIGANGAGKTTTLRTISGLLPAAPGHDHLAAPTSTAWRPHEVVERGICQAPEGRGSSPDDRAGEPRDGRVRGQGSDRRRPTSTVSSSSSRG